MESRFRNHFACNIFDKACNEHAEIAMSVRVDMPGVGVSPPAVTESVYFEAWSKIYSLLGKVRSDKLRMSSKMVCEWEPLVDHRDIIVLSYGSSLSS